MQILLGVTDHLCCIFCGTERNEIGMRSPLRDTGVEKRSWRADSVLEEVTLKSDTREASASVAVGS